MSNCFTKQLAVRRNSFLLYSLSSLTAENNYALTLPERLTDSMHAHPINTCLCVTSETTGAEQHARCDGRAVGAAERAHLPAQQDVGGKWRSAFIAPLTYAKGGG